VAAVLIQIFWKFVRKVVLMISGLSWKIGQIRSKTKSQELNIENLFNTLVAAVFIQITWKFIRKVVLMISRSSLNMGRVRSKIG
jgi:1,4-dihydroxy-2-naphthoate octaprenyltransferase